MMRFAALALLVVAPLCPAAAATEALAAHPEATPYDESISDARYAQELAQTIDGLGPDRRVLAVFGANWCHDSRALAGWLTSPALAPLVSQHFDVVFIDVGHPQEGHGRNLDLAARFGVTGIEGTPNLLVIDGKGALVNTPESARGWRNAASRSEESIMAILSTYVATPE